MKKWRRRGALCAGAALFLSCLALSQTGAALAEESSWNLEDNTIEFYEVPALTEKYSGIAKLEQAVMESSTAGMRAVDNAVDAQRKDIVAELNDEISELKAQRTESRDESLRNSLSARIREMERVRDSRKLVGGLDQSLGAVSEALSQLRSTKDSVAQARRSAQTAVKANFYTGKKLLENGMQEQFFSVKKQELARSLQEQRVALYQAEYEKTEKKKALGQATEQELQSALVDLNGAKADLQTAENGLSSLRRAVGVSLGWKPENCGGISFGDTPDYPRNYMDSRNLEADTKSALQQNKEFGDAQRIADKDFTTWDKREISIAETEQRVRAAVRELSRNTREKAAAWEASETTAEIARAQAEKAEHLAAVGMSSRQDTAKLKLAALQKESEAKTAKLDYEQSIYDYEQAVTKGVMEI
ncbi:hypothetical protein GCWU000341_00170 [Oribacterium sp. oral taxon 078 str. F0262]|uniref:hypothetical protein n=1 Tax=Oribacterium sp. oral taxon 078 TaxID=652706 RepID=UPI0001BCC1F5|nr:hypothetical protein [Oribacterium sp. oral taxon 078]EFE93091.1 hypothetical protein GCWU000341_00170 [Oribacterium sp. oral taxon 078 str. F0262]